MQEVVVGKAITLEQRRLEQAMLVGIPEEKRRQLDALLRAYLNRFISYDPQIITS